MPDPAPRTSRSAWRERPPDTSPGTGSELRLRHRLRAALQRRLGLHDRFGLGLPETVIDSVEDYVRRAADGSFVVPIRDAYAFVADCGRIDSPIVRRRFETACRVELPPFQVACLKNVRLYSRGTYLLSAGRRAVFLESARSPEKLRKDVARDALRRRPLRRLEGRHFLGFDRWGYNYYYHWMVETLSRHLALERAPEDARILLPRRTLPYMLRSLECFGGVDPARFLVCDEEDWELEECWFPTKPYGWLVPSPREAREVARRILARSRGRGIGARKLYVSRARCSTRRLSNEDSVREYLEKRGFVTFFPEAHPLDVQIATFREAREIVASFGSAMANLMFCEPGAEVVILYDESYFDASNHVLGACFGHRMHGVAHRPSAPLSLAALAEGLDSIS